MIRDTKTLRQVIEERAKSFEEYLSECIHAPHEKQSHLNAGSEAKAYWSHGYLMALRDVSSLLPTEDDKQ